jgi:hypothetical protein
MKEKASRGPTAEEQAHMDRVRDLGCCVTGRTPVHIHHVMKCPGKNRRRDHRFVVPLTPELHNMGPQSVHMLGSEDEFFRIHGIDLAAWAVAAWECSKNGI